MTPSLPSRPRLVVGAVAILLVASLLSVPLAQQRALAAEESYLTDRLSDASCLTDWGVHEGAGPERSASVTGVALGGLRVSVTVPYAYSMPYENETLYADAGSNAAYVVTLTGATRVEGPDVSPCD